MCIRDRLGITCDDPEVREFITALGVPANHKVYGCVALGYPDSVSYTHLIEERPRFSGSDGCRYVF